MPAIPLAPVPPPPIRESLPSQQWEACLDLWITLLGLRLRLPEHEFAATHEATPIADKEFLVSCFKHASGFWRNTSKSSKASSLRRLCFEFTKRLLMMKDHKSALRDILAWPLLALLIRVYNTGHGMKHLLGKLWEGDQQILAESIENGKTNTIRTLSLLSESHSVDSSRLEECDEDIQALTLLVLQLPAAGQILMTGSDYIDTLCEAYTKLSDREKRIRNNLVANLYVILKSLMETEPPSFGLLLDQLFSLKSSFSPSHSSSGTILSDVLCTTDISTRLSRVFANSGSTKKRAETLLPSLKQIRAQSGHLYGDVSRLRKKDKGKQRVMVKPGVSDEVHAHRLSLVDQIQELFPDLGQGYVARLLDFFHDNVQEVIMHLLDDTLPKELREIDKHQGLKPVYNEEAKPLATPFVPERRNTYDDDAFDRLEVPTTADPSTLKTSTRRDHIILPNENRKNAPAQDEVLSDPAEHAKQKAAIFAALANFDSDDDERDDTYDVADVGGTIDSPTVIGSGEPDGAGPVPDGGGGGRPGISELDVDLYKRYKSDADVFSRAAHTRRSPGRMELKKATGLADEVLEGWALMLGRDEKKRRKLEDILFMTRSHSNVRRPEKSAQVDEEQEDHDEEERRVRPGPSRGHDGKNRGGRGSRGKGRAGGTPSSSSQRGNKTKHFSHHRRDQHAKKMARATGGDMV